MASYADAIAGIESSGRYNLVGPTHPKYGRALGKYQVMESNLPQWSQKYLGRQITPEEFLASKEAQDAIFQGEFGRLAGKHGPEGAARAWFAGEGGMNDPNRKDSLGTSVADYARKFNAAYGGGGEAAPMAGGPAPSDSPAGSAGAPMGLLPSMAGNGQTDQIQGLLAGLMGQQQPAQQQSPMGLLGDMAPQQQQPAPEAPAHEPPDPKARRPINLAGLQALLQRPRLGSSWSL
jgi:hypothetical protein